MSNHTHISSLSILMKLRPGPMTRSRVAGWRFSLERSGTLKAMKQKEYIHLGLRSDPERMKEIRSRLGSLSWFMRALNEPIARWANEKTAVLVDSGRGRFKCQALLEEQAVLSAMAYV